MGISIGVTLWATGNPKSKSDSSKIPAGNPTPTSGADMAQAPKDMKPGKVKINVTWQYNDYVGNKPDTNAVVILIPKGFKGRVPSSASVITMPDPEYLISVLTGRGKSCYKREFIWGVLGVTA